VAPQQTPCATDFEKEQRRYEESCKSPIAANRLPKVIEKKPVRP
jgi:hypothetical protein